MNTKISYIVTLISIAGLSILLFFIRPKDKVEQTVLRLTLPKDQGDGIFTRKAVSKTLKGKKIITINLNDCPVDDRGKYIFDKKLHLIDRQIEQLKFTNDTFVLLQIQSGVW
ncbi:MAG TPA: hypothetical protein VJ647_03185 [Chitinophagaceae bacterium]|nr:hypothetical protein [Chitinophagaceae bacterium]